MQVSVCVTFGDASGAAENVRAQLDEFIVTTSQDRFGESFTTQPAESDCIVSGLVELSERPIEGLRQMTHWGRALTQARRQYPQLAWCVELDGHPVPWEEERGYGSLILDDEDIEIIDYALQNF